MSKFCVACGKPIKRNESKVNDFEGLVWHLHCKRKALKKETEERNKKP